MSRRKKKRDEFAPFRTFAETVKKMTAEEKEDFLKFGERMQEAFREMRESNRAEEDAAEKTASVLRDRPEYHPQSGGE